MLKTLSAQPEIKSLLEKLFVQQKVPHALLLTGFDSQETKEVACELASYLLETNQERLSLHPDFFHLRPEGKSGQHPIDAIRSLIDQVHKASFSGGSKVFLIEDAEKMLPTSSNALLKTLEEPSSKSYFLLTTSYPDRILPTIGSRTHRISLSGKKEEDVDFLEIQELLLSCLSQKMSYRELSVKMKEIESKIEKKEDPYLTEKRREKVFLTLSLWVRDQKAQKYGALPLLKGSTHFSKSFENIDFHAVEKKIVQAKEAMQRNIAFSVCLETIVLMIQNS